MRNSKSDITALYLRFWPEDDQEVESDSIANQRTFLQEYARKNQFENVRVFADSGDSQDSFQEMMALVEAGMVKTVIVKDMSRFGRNYIEVGRLAELTFPKHNVRLIAVNDCVDSAAEDDFIPLRNLMNQWVLSTISHKLRLEKHTKSSVAMEIGKLLLLLNIPD